MAATTAEEKMAVIAEAENTLAKMNEGMAAFHKQSDALNAQMRSMVAPVELPNAAQSAAEDAKFDELEKQTQNIMKWFTELKSLRVQRDKLKAQKDHAQAVFEGLGGNNAAAQDQLQ